MQIFTDLYKFSVFFLNFNQMPLFASMWQSSHSSFHLYELTQPSRWDVDMWFIKREG